jgi:hypothetical protein
MKGKCACLADFFLLQKKEGDYTNLIREAKIAGIACRVAASSNKSINRTDFASQNSLLLRRYTLKYSVGRNEKN